MKAIICSCLIVLFLGFKANCQNNDTFAITFENDNWKNFIIFDSSADVNIWTIEKPKGIVFNKAWEGDNALYTDKSLVSSFPNKSTFIITIPVDTFKSHSGTFGFYFKTHTGKNKSFSLKYGTKWQDSQDLLYGGYSYHWTYKPINSKQVYSHKIPPFNDTISGWIYAEFQFGYIPMKMNLCPSDTFTLIFSYNTDSNNIGEGFIIDSFYSSLYIASVQESDFSKNYLVYPNPAKRNINVSTDIPGNKDLEFIDIYGRIEKRHSFQTTGLHTIDLDGLTNGVYILKITDESGIFVRKVMINN